MLLTTGKLARDLVDLDLKGTFSSIYLLMSLLNELIYAIVLEMLHVEMKL